MDTGRIPLRRNAGEEVGACNHRRSEGRAASRIEDLSTNAYSTCSTQAYLATSRWGPDMVIEGDDIDVRDPPKARSYVKTNFDGGSRPRISYTYRTLKSSAETLQRKRASQSGAWQ